MTKKIAMAPVAMAMPATLDRLTATMIMPRYQGQGLDGYFLACAVAG